MFNTPILFLIFNRPDTTEQVFTVIKKIKPSKLYIAADGARPNRPEEKELCSKTRAVVESIDWPCEVHRLYSETNKGCKINVSEAITWFFNNVEEGIVLEDDCLPDISFFSFCEDLLTRYRENNRVKLISGDNFQFGNTTTNESYYFSNSPHIWGWATWKRVWDEYDITMKTFPEFKKNEKIKTIFKSKKIQSYFLKTFEKLYQNKVDTWDGQLVYSIFDHDGVSILPSVNLVTNIGFSSNATHTKEDSIFSRIPAQSITNIVHPKEIKINEKADTFYFESFVTRSLVTKILNKLASFIK